MSATVLKFKSATLPIAQFARIDSAHRRLGELYATGHLPIKRAVFDASRIGTQKELVDAFRRDGVEIVLDTEVAELAAKEKFLTHAKKAPWAAAAEGQLLDASYFDGSRSQFGVIRWIAKFAVENNVDTVLAPTHFLADKDFDGWLPLDTRSCLALRTALDQEGGQRIAIDYPIIHSHASINQADFRNTIIERIDDLPIDNIWIRASGLGNQPRPLVVNQFLTSLYDLQRSDRPIIVDHVDGLMAQALIAFGGASGTASGIGERSLFNANNWHKLPKERDENDDFRRATRLPIAGLGRNVSKKELQLLASAKGGQKYCACQDGCCQHGVRDMIADPRQHAAHQTVAPIQALEAIPDLNREHYFLEKPLRNAERLARNIKDLNPATAEAESLGVDLISLKRRLSEHHRKIGKFSDALNKLHDERLSGGQRANACGYRFNQGTSNVERDR